MYYTPMKINQWRISLSVPESVVFESSIIIKDILNAFLWFELLCFAVYLLWMLRDVKRVTTEKQKRLDMIQHIQEIEHFLFNAHEKKENLFAAIEQLGSIIAAERISFWILEGSINQQYSWQKGQPATEHIDDLQLPSGKLMQYFLAGYDLYEAYMPADIEFVEANATAKNISNLIAIPVKDVVGGQLSGVLAVSNFKKDESAIALLKAMSFSFGMFCNNVKNRADLQEQGDRDTLTGMYNRNRYERDLTVLFSRYQSALTCIYIDVNGLREMNGPFGNFDPRGKRGVANQQYQHLSLGVSACKLIYKRLDQKNVSMSPIPHKVCGSKFPKGPNLRSGLNYRENKQDEVANPDRLTRAPHNS